MVKSIPRKSYCMSLHTRYKRLIPLVWGCFLLACLLAGEAVCFCLSPDRGVTVTATVQTHGSDGSVGRILLSEELYEVSGGEAAALLLTLEVSEGWRMEAVSETPSTQRMRITAAFSEGGRRAAVLLDGYPQKTAGDGRILNVTLVREAETFLPCLLTVSRGQYGEAAVCVLSTGGEIRTIPLRFETLQPSDTEDEIPSFPDTEGGSMQVTPSEPADTDGDPSSETHETHPPTESERPLGDPLREPAFSFIGCRETPARDGCFSVQLLFVGETDYTPAVCFSGGTGVTVEVTRLSAEEILGDKAEKYGGGDTESAGILRACTFFGLSAHGETVFIVDTPEGILRVSYRNGIFSGYELLSCVK